MTELEEEKVFYMTNQEAYDVFNDMLATWMVVPSITKDESNGTSTDNQL